MSRLGHPLSLGLICTALLVAGVARDRESTLALKLEHLERYTLDLRFRIRDARPAGDEVVILAIDDRTRSRMPGHMNRRSSWAELLRAVHRTGARTIGVDGLFSTPERPLERGLQDDIRAHVEASAGLDAGVDQALALLRRVDAETRGDEELARAIAECGDVVLAMYLRTGESADVAEESLEKARYGQDFPGDQLPPRQGSATAALPMFNQAATALGLVSVEEDQTETVREMPLALRFRQGTYAPLAVHLVAALLDLERGQLAYSGVDHSVHIGKLKIPLTERGGIRLNFRGARGRFRTYSVADLLQGGLPKDALRGRVVLIGYTYFGHDTVRTSFGPGVPGVELHATAIDNILRGDWLRRSSVGLDALITLLFGLLLSLLYSGRLRVSVFTQALGAVVVLGVYLVGTLLLFSYHELWLGWIGPLLVMAVVSPVCLASSFLSEGLQRRRLRRTFSHYLSDDLIDQLLADPSMLALGGERRDLTVLFSDIRDFTSLSERIDPEELVAFLNAYLTPMTRRVLGRGGYLDKYVGDAIMALFGAPLKVEDHARRALAAALDMQEELGRLRPELAARDIDLAIGLGINSGEVVVGNMGSTERFDYTAIGDAVNLAARLEGLCKRYRVACLVGETTRRAAGDAFLFREVDRVRVKGKRESVCIFELLGDGARSIAEYQDLERFDAALAAYHSGELGSAREGFAAFAQANPHDHVARIHLERLEELGDTPPPGWDGVSEQTEK